MSNHTEHQPPEGQKGKGNLNTILVSIVLAVLIWVGNATFQNSVKLAEINASLVSRSEVEAKLAANRLEISRLEVEVQDIKLEIVKIKSKEKS